jgi:hypothetical protein
MLPTLLTCVEQLVKEFLVNSTTHCLHKTIMFNGALS